MQDNSSGNSAYNTTEYLTNDSFSDDEIVNLVNTSEYLNANAHYVLTVIYISIFVIGVIGNVLTCTVIIIGSSMRTTTNYYLFNLAIADLLFTTLNVLCELLKIWCPGQNIFANKGCFFRVYVSEILTEVSILTIIGFSIERYQVIRNPFKIPHKSRAIKTIVTTWIIASACAYLPASQVFIQIYGNRSICLVQPTYIIEIVITMTSIFFIMPMIILTIMYAFIGVILIESSRIRKKIGRYKKDFVRKSPKNIDSITRRSLKISVTVVVAFFVCFAPFHIQRLTEIYLHFHQDSNSESTHTIFTADIYSLIRTYIVCLLYLLSGAINPIIYSVVSKKFRNAFKEVLMKITCLRNSKKSLPIVLNEYRICKIAESRV